MAAMLGGEFAAAWRESDLIRMRNTPDPHRFWNGESIKGKRVIVRGLHGLGDSVQMLRYAPALNALAASVVFELPGHMLALARCFNGVNRAITWGEDSPSEPVQWDIQIEVMELPYVFRTTLTELPIQTGYLELLPEIIEQSAQDMGPKTKPRVGLVWAAGAWNPERAVPINALRPLMARQGIEFWSIQGGDAARDARVLGIRDAAESCGAGLLPLAAAIEQMDLVITVDTLAAHLAGALGKQVWVMLQYAADWRWMTAREDSPWYPTMRLFRQRTPGDWGSVVSAISDSLTSAVK